MADQMETPQELRARPVAAKRSHTGLRILRVLLAALLVAFAVWIPAEIWSRYNMPQHDEPIQATPATPPNGAGGSTEEASPAPPRAVPAQ